MVPGISYVACTPTFCQVSKPPASSTLLYSRGRDCSENEDSSDGGVSSRRRRSNSPGSRASQVFVEDRYHTVTYVRVWACIEMLPRCVVVDIIEDHHRKRTKERVAVPRGGSLTAVRSDRCLYHNSRHPGKCCK